MRTRADDINVDAHAKVNKTTTTRAAAAQTSSRASRLQPAKGQGFQSKPEGPADSTANVVDEATTLHPDIYAGAPAKPRKRGGPVKSTVGPQHAMRKVVRLVDVAIPCMAGLLKPAAPDDVAYNKATEQELRDWMREIHVAGAPEMPWGVPDSAFQHLAGVHAMLLESVA